MTSPKEILQKYWGYTSFRSLQEEIIQAALDNKDLIALLPTGAGKSLCYQIPALCKKGICLVISPLVSLMQDQIEQLANRGIRALAVQSKLTENQIIDLFETLKCGHYKFLYLSPERLQSELVLKKIEQTPIDLIAVDEAHCISEWGHDFRPSYRLIKRIRTVLPKISIIAVTATATDQVAKDIAENLALRDVLIFRKSFYRSNLAYQIIPCENKLDKLEQIFKKTPQPTIIYVNSRKKTEDISNFINRKGYQSTFYHAGMSAADKTISFDLWMKEKRLIMVATNAFGMGIDKPNVRVVVHLDLPNSVENYVQEAGRAGRDGQKSFSVVLQNENDHLAYKRNTIENIPTVKEIKQLHRKLYQYFHIARGELSTSYYDFNFLAFCEAYQLKQKKASIILQILINSGIIQMDLNFFQKSAILFTISSSQLINHHFNSKLSRELIDVLLRSYGSAFRRAVAINEFDIAKRLGVNSTKIRSELRKLEGQNILSYREANTDEKVLFLVPREDDKTINRVSKNIQKLLDLRIKKSEQLLAFITNNTVCRSVQLARFFREKNPVYCTICDVCISKKKSVPKDFQQKIMDLIKGKREISQEEITSYFHVHADEKTIIKQLRHLLSKDSIAINENNNFFIL